MSTSEEYKRVYTGSETNAQYLQELFSESNIHSRIRNDVESARLAGFGSTHGMVLLFVFEKDFDEALKIARSTFPNDFDHE